MRWSDELLAAARRLQASLRLDPSLGFVPGWDRVGPDDSDSRPQVKALSRSAVIGENPAGLGMLAYVPDTVAMRPPLVVLLHGCHQDAGSFARDSGWIDRVGRARAVLLVPEQLGTNNPARCFNWFRAADPASGGAELLSLREMIDTACTAHRCDRRQIYVVGLSAGGAMAAALMAAYPDIVSAGAVVAGLPVGCAGSMREALGRMANAEPQIEDVIWAQRARALAPKGYTGLWPRLSVWHGEADQAVDPTNANILVRQWRALHALNEVPTHDVALNARARQRMWRVKSRAAVEWWSLAGLDHGYPVGTRPDGGKWVLHSAVDATDRIAEFFGLEG
jgi:poly(hydroxyalkanoate) depolymerase family esterase